MVQIVVALIGLGLLGLVLIVVGVHVLFGVGHSLIAAGIAVLLLAAFIRSGITPNG